MPAHKMRRIINFHRDDPNIGDQMSAPTRYFDFPDHEVVRADLIDETSLDLDEAIVILGGGGLLDTFFLPAIERIRTATRTGRLIAWGVGQQLDTGPWWQRYPEFPYARFLEGFDLVGIRDDGFAHPWVPCASCMHPIFDAPPAPHHEFVVFSHRSRPLPILEWPNLRNDQADFEETIAFLASGETIITSSYHGLYWGMLLGRRVLAFPFNSKFLTLRHPPTLYPAIWERPGRLQRLLGRLRARTPSPYVCRDVEGWRLLAGASRAQPEMLEACRASNRAFHQRVLELIDQGD
ncbi:MAG: hypothetical protein J7D61_01165 [Marichromatium sp.]|nr:hypothetical protein [Marichromatium sp.]